MKGISTVIATLLMLIITIGLAGLAYTYISGVLTGTASNIIIVPDISCNGAADSITATIKNTDPKSTITTDFPVLVNGAQAGTLTTDIPVGETKTGSITSTVPLNPNTVYTIKVVGPSNAVEQTTQCG